MNPLKKLVRNKCLSDLLSQYVILSPYSPYKAIKRVVRHPKASVILAIPFFPISFVLTKALQAPRNESAEKHFEFEGQQIRFNVSDAATDLIEKTINNHGKFYEQDILEELRKYIPDQAVVLDVGANIGNHTIFFAKCAQAQRVLSFEPMKDVFAKLKGNVELNQCQQVELNPFGLGARSANCDTANLTLGNRGAQRISYSEDSTGIQVRAMDELDGIDRIDFIKIDVEGFEVEVLNGGKKTIARTKPVIFIESQPDLYPVAKRILEEELGYKLVKSFGEDNFLFSPQPDK